MRLNLICMDEERKVMLGSSMQRDASTGHEEIVAKFNVMLDKLCKVLYMIANHQTRCYACSVGITLSQSKCKCNRGEPKYQKSNILSRGDARCRCTSRPYPSVEFGSPRWSVRHRWS